MWHADAVPLALPVSSDTFVSALIGAFVGGLFALAGTWLADLLQRRRQGWIEALAVHAELGEWWLVQKSRFTEARDVLVRLGAGRSSHDVDEEFATRVDEIVQGLLDAIPPTLNNRLFIYGNETVYRRFVEAEHHLRILRIEMSRVRHPVVDRAAVEAGRMTANEAAERLSSAEVTTLRAEHAVSNAIGQFEQTIFAARTVQGDIRRKIRGSARLKPEK